MRTYEIGEAAHLLKPSKRTMRELIDHHHIPVARLGRQLLVTENELRRFIEWRVKVERKRRRWDE